MKKVSTVVAQQIRNFCEQKLTVGLDLGDRSNWYCVLDEADRVPLEQRLSATPKKPWAKSLAKCRAAGSR